MSDRAVVIAHFDPQGNIRPDLIDFIERLHKVSRTIVLVSTNLTQQFQDKMAALCQVIVRPNTGYDFYSYKVGLETLKDVGEYEEIILFNSSFLILDSEKLIRRILEFPRKPLSILGLTKSEEYHEHLQSYFVIFSKQVISARYFKQWWEKMEAIDKREDVIREYELGMSQFFIQQGCTLDAIFERSEQQYQKAYKRYKHIYKQEPATGTLNPTHFNWDDLLEQVGIIKVEVVQKNPHGLNLGKFFSSYGVSHSDLIHQVRSAPLWHDRARRLKRSVRGLLTKSA